MTLTEEQRVALARAIDYINETDLPVGELDGFDREVLRAMIDSSDPITDVTELVELLAAGEHEQWAAWAQAILDSEPGLSDGRKAAWPEMIATPYENLSEELKDKDRREVYLRSQVALDHIQQQSAEIERLRANAEQHERVIEARSEVIDQRAALIKSLKKEIRRLKHESKVEQEFTNSYILHLHEAEARIKELEADNQNLVTMNKALMKNDWILRDNNGKYRKRAQKAELLNKSLKSKIGPDAKPRSWQITDERKATLSASLKVLERLKKNNTDTDHSYLDRGITVLRAMLREAE